MQAFHNDVNIKNKLIDQLQAHYDADEIIKGVYWEGGKGCAIGCAIHSNDHSLYEERFAIPKWLSKVQDVIFEGLPNQKAKEWPLIFTKSVNVGADLNKIKIPFLIFIVESVINKFDHKKFPDAKKNINNIINILKNNHDNKESLIKAASGAYAAAAAAAGADAGADAAADADAAAAAAYADAAAAAAYAAYAAAAAAYAAAAGADAAYATAAGAYAADAADAGAYAADAADAAYAAAYAAADVYGADAADAANSKEKQYEKFADKLIELVEKER